MLNVKSPKDMVSVMKWIATQMNSLCDEINHIYTAIKEIIDNHEDMDDRLKQIEEKLEKNNTVH